MLPVRRVGLAAEHESPEDPAGSEVRVALTPAAVRQISGHGHSVAVEAGAGTRMGFSDDDYRAAGAVIVARDELYRDRDVVIKIKGPAHAELRTMDRGSLLVCMAHVKSIPQRAAICDELAIDLLALELVTERPPGGEAWVRSKLAMERILAADGRPARELHIAFAGFEADAFGALQHAARSHPRSLEMLATRHPEASASEAAGAAAAAAGAAGRAAAAEAAGAAGRAAAAEAAGAAGRAAAAEAAAAAQAAAAADPRDRSGRGTLVVDLGALAQAAAQIPASEVEPELLRLPARRKIESLHETGRAGARFGLDLAVRVNDRLGTARDAYVTVLGYGNVAFGALDECVRSGVPRTHIRTERTTERALLRPDLEASDLIVNGIDGREDPSSYVITDDDLGSVIRAGTVVVDLVGGSATNRGAVEPIVECTTPDDPFVVVDGVYLSSVWGWPLVGFARESMERYSEQILRMLLFEERVLDGIEDAPDGIRAALVAGPLSARAPG